MILQNTRNTSNKHGAGQRGGAERKKAAKEQLRLNRFVICVILFLVVFAGKGVFPERINKVEQEFLDLLGMDTDFRAAFYTLGQSLLQQELVLQEIGAFCVDVFGGEDEESATVFAAMKTQMEQERNFFNSDPDHAEFTAHLLGMEKLPEEWLAPSVPEKPESSEDTVPAVGTVLRKADYQGKELPEGYTMDHISFGTLETATPVTGTLWSGYGYRDHPIDGAYKFHNGVDLGAEHGASIEAFAAGLVEYIGENDAYGLYLQLDHGNGIKSFYAHCSKLCVGQGQRVETGEKVAEVGETGSATGPHLHFELKYAGTHVDPAYYVTYALPT